MFNMIQDRYSTINSQMSGVPGYAIIDANQRYVGFVPRHGHLTETPAVLCDGTKLTHDCMDLGDAIDYLLKESSKMSPQVIRNSDVIFHSI